jgi:hypothetical protein
MEREDEREKEKWVLVVEEGTRLTHVSSADWQAGMIYETLMLPTVRVGPCASVSPLTKLSLVCLLSGKI